MKRTLITSAAALLLAGATVGGTAANELTQPRDGGSADITFNTNLPADMDGAFTAPDYETTEDPIANALRRELVQMAIENGQTTSSKSESEPKQTGEKEPTPKGVTDHANAYFGRIEARGVDVGQG